MRGKDHAAVIMQNFCGITPAHAGKSRIPQGALLKSRDHPRPCGEKFWRFRWPSWKKGSPPPMRGKDIYPCCAFHSNGITPAHAGKRWSGLEDGGYHRDHPRPCGEKSARALSITARAGSPPPMRGKERLAAIYYRAGGITPAHAGKRLRKRRNTGIFVFQISRFHLVSHTLDTSYGNRPALYVHRLPRTPAALQASKAYDRARWAAYAWLFAVCPHTGS